MPHVNQKWLQGCIIHLICDVVKGCITRDALIELIQVTQTEAVGKEFLSIEYFDRLQMIYEALDKLTRAKKIIAMGRDKERKYCPNQERANSEITSG